MLARKMGMAVLAATAGLAMLAGPAAASAPSTDQGTVEVASTYCKVRYNWTPYYDDFGTFIDYVHAGQGFTAHRWDNSWYRGDLQGGRSGVWIYSGNLEYPCGPR